MIALLSAGFLLCPNAYAQVTFSDEVAGQMIMEVERLDVDRKLLEIQKQITSSAKEEAAALRDQIASQKEQIDFQKKGIDDLQRIAKTQDENCKKQIEAAKPSFWSRLGTHVTAMGVGGVIAAVLVLLL